MIFHIFICKENTQLTHCIFQMRTQRRPKSNHIDHLTSKHVKYDITYLKCRERYEDMIDHRSYVYNLCSCKIKD